MCADVAWWHAFVFEAIPFDDSRFLGNFPRGLAVIQTSLSCYYILCTDLLAEFVRELLARAMREAKRVPPCIYT